MKFLRISFISLLCCGTANAQGRPIDWPSYGGDAQRTGWERIDSRITKDNVKDFRLVLKRTLASPQGGTRSLTPPVVLGLLISYRGFKELAFIAGNSGMWAIDADLDRIFWQKHFNLAGGKSNSSSAECSGPATPGLIPPINFGAARPRPALGNGPGAAPSGPPVDTFLAPRPTGRAMLTATGFGAPRPVFAIFSDGKLRLLNTSTGDDVVPAISFLPPGSQASSLTVHGGAVYTTTSAGCGSGSGAVWAIDLTVPEPAEPPVAHFALNGGSISHLGGLALGTDDTVYVQTGPGRSDPNSNKWSNTLLALTPKNLKLKQYFTASAAEASGPTAPDLNVVTPVVFAYAGKDLVATAGADGRVYLLDGATLGGTIIRRLCIKHRRWLRRVTACGVVCRVGKIRMGRGLWQYPCGGL